MAPDPLEQFKADVAAALSKAAYLPEMAPDEPPSQVVQSLIHAVIALRAAKARQSRTPHPQDAPDDRVRDQPPGPL